MHWYVEQVTVGKEYQARDILERSYPGRVYLPEYKRDKRRLSKRQKEITPVFPGYLFLNLSFTEDDWTHTKYVSPPNAIGMSWQFKPVKFGDNIPFIDDNFIRAFKRYEEHAEDFKYGEQVFVNYKAFVDVPALIKKTTDEKIEIMFTWMGRKCTDTIPRFNDNGLPTVTPI